jgi:hypothetical protein
MYHKKPVLQHQSPSFQWILYSPVKAVVAASLTTDVRPCKTVPASLGRNVELSGASWAVWKSSDAVLKVSGSTCF